MENYFQIYLLGCFLVLSLTFSKIVLSWTISWITKDNIYLANLRKILPPNEDTFQVKFAKFIAMLAGETFISWINVPFILWQIAMLIIVPIRNSVSSQPEVAKKMLFPLRNNPELEPETVWALFVAFAIQYKGKQPDANAFLAELYGIRKGHPRFNCKSALQQLRDLNAAKPEVVDLALNKLDSGYLEDFARAEAAGY